MYISNVHLLTQALRHMVSHSRKTHHPATHTSTLWLGNHTLSHPRDSLCSPQTHGSDSDPSPRNKAEQTSSGSEKQMPKRSILSPSESPRLFPWDHVEMAFLYSPSNKHSCPLLSAWPRVWLGSQGEWHQEPRLVREKRQIIQSKTRENMRRAWEQGRSLQSSLHRKSHLS